jgi:hypothetical protein
MKLNYILVGQTPVACDDVLVWAEWFETAERRVRLTRVGPYQVSTVFLGLDHNWSGGEPILFETMIYVEQQQSPEDRVASLFHDSDIRFPSFLEYQTRCSTWLEAEAMHERAVAATREQGDEVEQLYPVPVEAEIKP